MKNILQVQPIPEVVHRDGHKLVHGDNIVGVQERAASRLVHQRPDKRSAGSYHLHHIRVEG